MSKLPLIALGALLLGGVAITVMKAGTGSNGGHPTENSAQLDPATIRVPELSMLEKRGEAVFNANCQVCHGPRGSGTDQGPPFMSRIYVPSHHADGAFALAVKTGVRPHHWPYGPMPPQPQIDDSQLQAIIAYVRALQRANGFAN